MNNYSDSRNIASFLTLGYFLDYHNPHPQFNINTPCIDKEKYKNIDDKHKYINYMNFNKSIREKTDLYKRDIIGWIDISKVLKDHIENRGNYADALVTLCSFEIHLKTGKRL